MAREQFAQGQVAASCATCVHFCSEPLDLENAIAGLRSFGSGFASVRADDGLCVLHDRYLSAAAHCARHSPNASAVSRS